VKVIIQTHIPLRPGSSMSSQVSRAPRISPRYAESKLLV
jgi:hypothetical protein